MRSSFAFLTLLVGPFSIAACSAAGNSGLGSGGGSTSDTSVASVGAGLSTTDAATTGSGSTGAGTGGETSTTTTGTGSGAGAGGSATTTSNATTSTTTTTGAGGGSPDAVVRVHYPAGSHSLTIRGGAGGLSWTQGASTSASGDTFTYTFANLTAPAEWKPLLDDTTWARGPNYHIVPGQTLDVWPHFNTVTGQVKTLIESFHSTALGNDRTIYAYLPPSYDENTDAKYPVVYMHDGQNLWAALPQLAFGATWNVDTTFDAAAESGACSSASVVGWGAQPLGGTPATCTGDGDCSSGECRTFPEAIVIGIANTSGRIYEYTPTTDPGTPGGGGADLYVKMLVEELKPAIDGMLRTRPEVGSTVLAGSSLGGLVTAYAGLKHPEVFGLLAEVSPSTWWNNDVIVGDVQTTHAAPARPLLVYLDSGQGTADDEADTDQLATAYLGLGYVEGKTFRHVVQAGASHSEVYWAERFPGALQLLLGSR